MVYQKDYGIFSKAGSQDFLKKIINQNDEFKLHAPCYDGHMQPGFHHRVL